MGLGMKMRTVRGHASALLPMATVRSRKVAPAPDVNSSERGAKVFDVHGRQDRGGIRAVQEQPNGDCQLVEKKTEPVDVSPTSSAAIKASPAHPTKRRPSVPQNSISPQRRRPRHYDVVKEVALAQASISNSRRKIESVLADFYVPQRAVVMGNLVAVVGEYFVASEQSFEICLRDSGTEKGSMLDEEEEDSLVDDDDEGSLGSAFSVLLDDDIFDASRDRVHHFMWRKDVLRPTACGAGMCMPFGVTRVSTQVEL